MIKISSVAFEARNTLRSSGIPVSHAVGLELAATLLGYGTYAALKHDPTIDVDEMFAMANHVILQPATLAKRIQKLGLDESHAAVVNGAFVAAFREAAGGDEGACRFHASMADFKDFIFEDVQSRAFEDDDVGSAYAETNAYIDEFYTETYEFEPLVTADGEWTLVASGTHTGDIDSDRPYAGHAGNFTATYTFQKEGRCGLVETDLQFGLDFDASYD
ncbi:hypothetical protein [Xanthomonas arboricola]|uniref:hypothetical protein n=1 Tax=Xanthomonas arboricola TaxID=56448 RepID=UPI000CEE8D80|nr:hypothetical protein [Xanthomonas arboricola]PPT49355.1 hypothetical protein XarjCFBP7652_09115 [Xanthomonas arboricola]